MHHRPPTARQKAPRKAQRRHKVQPNPQPNPQRKSQPQDHPNPQPNSQRKYRLQNALRCSQQPRQAPVARRSSHPRRRRSGQRFRRRGTRATMVNTVATVAQAACACRTRHVTLLGDARAKWAIAARRAVPPTTPTTRARLGACITSWRNTGTRPIVVQLRCCVNTQCHHKHSACN